MDDQNAMTALGRSDDSREAQEVPEDLVDPNTGHWHFPLADDREGAQAAPLDPARESEER